MLDGVNFFLGVLAGFLVSVAYSHTNLPYARKDTFMEHYLWGLVFLNVYALTGMPFFLGFGLALVVEERFQDHPFAIGKPTFPISTLMAIVLITSLAFILMLRV